LERGPALAVLTIDNPPMNLFTVAVLDGIAGRLEELAADPPRALLVRGAGALTSGGVDVTTFTTATPDTFAQSSAHYIEDIVHPLQSLPCPTVAACHGLCLTAAFELALSCDLIIARSDTQFGLVEAALGLTPAMGGTARLAARAGLGRAHEMVLTSRTYPASTMLEWGVVNRIYDEDRFHVAATRFAERLAEGPTLAHAATKTVLRAYAQGGVDAADRATPPAAAALFDTQDLRNGIESFLRDGPGRAAFSGQ
jgi:enoyl-CoA hydratase/carnithine racemase